MIFTNERLRALPGTLQYTYMLIVEYNIHVILTDICSLIGFSLIDGNKLQNSHLCAHKLASLSFYRSFFLVLSLYTLHMDVLALELVVYITCTLSYSRAEPPFLCARCMIVRVCKEPIFYFFSGSS